MSRIAIKIGLKLREIIDEFNEDKYKGSAGQLVEMIENQLLSEIFEKGDISEKARWIPVEELLPEDRKFVLVLCDDKIVYTSGYSEKGDLWFCKHGKPFKAKVTHWKEEPKL